MKGFDESAQFPNAFEYKQAKQLERKADRVKRAQRRDRGGRRHPLED